MDSKNSNSNQKIRRISLSIGIALLVLGAILISWKIQYAVQSEISYVVNKPKVEDIKVELNNKPETFKKDNVVFLNPSFGLAIPKIDANANVLANIDPTDISEYNEALTKGVAHAKGSSLPGFDGNVFLFAHSAVNYYETSKYNIYFYLLNKLEKGDDIYVSYNSKIFKYKVEEVKLVKRTEVKYLSKYKEYNTLTLMTCWPAGIDINRLIVTAKEVE